MDKILLDNNPPSSIRETRRLKTEVSKNRSQVDDEISFYNNIAYSDNAINRTPSES
jgi:hypothetical protein